MTDKKLLTMQDLSCVGQCSLTVALPILSAYGIETGVLPTAVLSNHTMFKGWSYLDLTPEIDNIFSHWEGNGFRFDAFLLGYLGKPCLMKVAEKCFDKFSADEAKIIIDPVFGDNGKLYPAFDANYVNEMRSLLKRADIILPNVTEACFLTGTEYKSEHDDEYIKSLAEKLFAITGGIVVITGVESKDRIGEFILYEAVRGKKTSLRGEYVMLKKEPQKRHGTGDIFASVFTANYLNGKSIADCCYEASQFVIDCLKATDGEHFYGVNFERVLKRGI